MYKEKSFSKTIDKLIKLSTVVKAYEVFAYSPHIPNILVIRGISYFFATTYPMVVLINSNEVAITRSAF